MDIKQNINYREEEREKYNILGYETYDYEKNGILTKTLPKVLFKGNSILVTFLQLLDVRIIMILKYIDKLKHFKHLSFYK